MIMLTIIIVAALVLALGLFLGRKPLKKVLDELKRKNREEEVKENSKLPLVQEWKEKEFKETLPLTTITNIGDTPIVVSLTGQTTNMNKEQPQNPPPVRLEIISLYDYLKKNINLCDVVYDNGAFRIYPYLDNVANNSVKYVNVNNTAIEIGELKKEFTLFPREVSLFSNLAKEESERRAVDSSVKVYDQLKGFAESLNA